MEWAAGAANKGGTAGNLPSLQGMGVFFCFGGMMAEDLFNQLEDIEKEALNALDSIRGEEGT
jgi:hypothetical protein